MDLLLAFLANLLSVGPLRGDPVVLAYREAYRAAQRGDPFALRDGALIEAMKRASVPVSTRSHTAIEFSLLSRPGGVEIGPEFSSVSSGKRGHQRDDKRSELLCLLGSVARSRR